MIKNTAPIGTVESPALGFFELASISRGLFLTDVILKKAPVQVVASVPVSSGKHVILFVGDVASVEESYKEATEHADGTLIRQVFIPGVHQNLAPFLDSLWNFTPVQNKPYEAIGIVESLTLAAAVLAADHSLKSAHVELCRMHLGQRIGGKAYFVLSGHHEDVEAALEAAQSCLKQLDSFVRVDLIPRPMSEALEHF